jgi:hypothetical protein
MLVPTSRKLEEWYSRDYLSLLKNFTFILILFPGQVKTLEGSARVILVKPTKSIEYKEDEID